MPNFKGWEIIIILALLLLLFGAKRLPTPAWSRPMIMCVQP